MVAVSMMGKRQGCELCNPRARQFQLFPKQEQVSNAQLDMTAIYNPGGWEHKHHVYCQSQGECLRHKTKC